MWVIVINIGTRFFSSIPAYIYNFDIIFNVSTTRISRQINTSNRCFYPEKVNPLLGVGGLNPRQLRSLILIY